MQQTKTWILTFDRPVALNRLISTLGKQGIKSSVFSNHPKLQILNENKEYVEDVVINNLNSTHSNSWCARSWNSIMIRSWHQASSLVLIQDDTNVSDEYGNWMNRQTQNFDFMWGPGGDQWHYLTYDVFKKTGYWDERYIGCYCADADYLKRVWLNNDQSRMLVHEEHNWGFMLNVTQPSDVREHILTEMNVKMADPNYVNQHWDLEKGGNPTIKASQRHFKEKWGVELDNGFPVIENGRGKFGYEIDWYPWFTKIHGVHINA